MATVLLPALVELVAPHDIVVMNYGLWSNRIRELKMHTEIFESAFRFHRDRMPNRTFWRETSAQHYDTISGERCLEAQIEATKPFAAIP